MCTYVHKLIFSCLIGYNKSLILCRYDNKTRSIGTGFIGRIELNGEEEDSTVLVTNYHVMIGGLDDSYQEATEVTPEMREKIEENARNSKIILTGSEKGQVEISLSTLVEGSCKVSPTKSVCLLVRILSICICLIDSCTVHNHVM